MPTPVVLLGGLFVLVFLVRAALAIAWGLRYHGPFGLR